MLILYLSGNFMKIPPPSRLPPIFLVGHLVIEEGLKASNSIYFLKSKF